MRVQHGVTGGCPTVAFTKPFRTLAHTPSFSASRGHVVVLEDPPDEPDDPPDEPDDPPDEPDEPEPEPGHLGPHPDTTANNTMFTTRNKARDLDAMILDLDVYS